MGANARRRFGGIFLICCAFLITSVIAVGNSNAKNLSGRDNLLLVLLSGILQAIGSSNLNKSGRADPSLARTAVRDLLALREITHLAREESEEIVNGNDPKDALKFIGKMSVHLSWMEESIGHAANNWAEFHPDAIKKMKEIEQ